jgi:hypothetical protein
VICTAELQVHLLRQNKVKKRERNFQMETICAEEEKFIHLAMPGRE